MHSRKIHQSWGERAHRGAGAGGTPWVGRWEGLEGLGRGDGRGAGSGAGAQLAGVRRGNAFSPGLRWNSPGFSIRHFPGACWLGYQSAKKPETRSCCCTTNNLKEKKAIIQKTLTPAL